MSQEPIDESQPTGDSHRFPPPPSEGSSAQTPTPPFEQPANPYLPPSQQAQTPYGGGYGGPPPANGQAYPGHGGYGPGATSHPNTITVFVLGLVGLFFCQFAGPFAWVMGGKARKEMRARGQAPDGMLTAGWVMGILATCLLVAFVLFFALLLGLALFTADGVSHCVSTTANGCKDLHDQWNNDYSSSF